MTTEQLIRDTIAVTDHLRERFGRERIYLLGHSWGSFLGMQVAARAPERYHAYIGMGQVAHQQRSEMLAYEYALDRFRETGDVRMVRRLEAAPVTMDAPLPRAYMKVRDAAMHRLGVGTTRDMRSVVTGVFVPVWRTPGYTVREKIAVGRGKTFSRGAMWDDFLATDLTATVTELKLPAYFCHGRHDHTCSYVPRPVVLPAAAGAGEGVLHLRAVRPQPGVRGARQVPADPARGRDGRRDQAGGRRVAGGRRWRHPGARSRRRNQATPAVISAPATPSRARTATTPISCAGAFWWAKGERSTSHCDTSRSKSGLKRMATPSSTHATGTARRGSTAKT